MPLDPLDPNHLALSPEQRTADKFATLDRRVSVAERTSLNGVARAGYLDPVIAKVSGSGGTVANFTDTWIGYTSAAIDTHGAWNGGSRLTAPRSGVYHVIGTLSLGVNAAGDRIVDITRNHTNHEAGFSIASAPGSTFQVSPSLIVPLDVGEYVELYCKQNSGSGIGVLFATLSFVWLGLRN